VSNTVTSAYRISPRGLSPAFSNANVGDRTPVCTVDSAITVTRGSRRETWARTSPFCRPSLLLLLLISHRALGLMAITHTFLQGFVQEGTGFGGSRRSTGAGP